MATPIEIRSSLADHLSVTSRSAEELRDLAAADSELVRTAQAGDRAAFGLLYRRYARMVHGILLARVPGTAAEDLVQDVFLNALSRIASLRDSSRFGGWLAAIARNRATDFHRQARPAVELDGEHESDAERAASPPSSAHGSEAVVILEAIRALPEAYRETLILRLVEGMTGPEIAERTGLTHGSVRVNLHRGMQQLRKLLADAKETSAEKTSLREGQKRSDKHE